jgi:NADH-quinone oxidoreductase subunit K
MVPLSWYIILSGVIFTIGAFGFLARKNIIIMFISIELMLNAANISLVAFSHYLQHIQGQIMVLFIIVVAAAEAAVGLGILIALFKNKETADINEVTLLKG